MDKAVRTTQNMNTRTDRLAERPPGLLDRIRASINNPSLMGEGGASLRYAKVQWSMILWRFLTLIQIPVLIAVCPSRFISTGYAAIFFSLALIYTIAYSWLAIRTSAAGKRYFRVIDLLIGAALLLAAHEATLVYVMVFYTYACLMNRPDLVMRETIPAVVGMSIVFLVASAMTPDPFYTQSSRISEFIIYYLWGLGIFVFSKLLSQASSLELDARLEEQRRSYRRSLHDDLGNTLCGLHYKIQSLRRAGSDELKQALAFLARGYERAIVVLAHLLDGIDAIADEDLAEALARTARWARTEFGVEVEVAAPEKEIRVSSTIRQEIILIVREAIANTAKHAGVKKARIVISRHRGRLSVAVTDFGTGFDSSGVERRQKTAGLGLTNMRERAEMINGRFRITSNPGCGTTVTLDIDQQKSGGFLNRFRPDSRRHPDRIYSFLISMKLLIAALVLVEFALLEPEYRSNPVAWLLASAVTIEGLSFFFFRFPLYNLLTRFPWLLAVEEVVFVLLIYTAWRLGIPLIFDTVPSIGLVFSACFLGTTGNVALASLLSLGILLANLLAPAAASMRAERLEDMVIDISCNLIIAFVAALAVEFIRNLDNLKQHEVTRALARQRELLTAETHRQLYSRVDAIDRDVQSLLEHTGDHQTIAESIAAIEAGSNDLKTRLRKILRSLDEPAGDPSLISSDR